MLKNVVAALAVFTAAAGFSAAQAQGDQQYGEEQEQMGTGGTEAQKEQNLYKADLAFDVQGTILEKDGNDYTIARPNLPNLQLELHDQTQVTLDGRQAQRDALKEGMPVRAKFQIRGDEIIAVKVEAQRGGMQQQQRQ